ncbi:MAG: hypothetical protein JRL30_30135 [Deltaproteobacteria bacterium]|nr:hypothetical protein [Deltaproteobacteria bacterium]
MRRFHPQRLHVERTIVGDGDNYNYQNDVMFFKSLGGIRFEYDGLTTDVESIANSDDLRTITLELEDTTDGYVGWTGDVNLGDYKYSEIDFDTAVQIEPKAITIDPASLPELDAEAEIWFYGLSYGLDEFMLEGTAYDEPCYYNGQVADGNPCGITVTHSDGEYFGLIVTGFSGWVIHDDFDGDGMDDGWEAANGLDNTTDDSQLDPDGDLLNNVEEFHAGTDPYDWDTDGDNYGDGEEYMVAGSDPTDPNSFPAVAVSTIEVAPALGLIELAVLLILGLAVLAWLYSK